MSEHTRPASRHESAVLHAWADAEKVDLERAPRPAKVAVADRLNDCLAQAIAALLAIRSEIDDVAEGRIDAAESPLRNAPHTVEDLVGDWDRPYSREQGCFPAGAFRVDKYWPPVGRVDNAHGDRNLICTCPPLEAYAEAAE